jgi:hypothetical protein
MVYEICENQSCVDVPNRIDTNEGRQKRTPMASVAVILQ